jgi:hypothetical protein
MSQVATVVYIPTSIVSNDDGTVPTLKGNINRETFVPANYIVTKKEMERFAERISGKGLYFQEIGHYINKVALAKSLGIKPADIKDIYVREEGMMFGLPANEIGLVRFTQSYQEVWDRMDAGNQHTYPFGSIVIQVRDAVIKSIKHSNHRAEDITEW